MITSRTARTVGTALLSLVAATGVVGGTLASTTSAEAATVARPATVADIAFGVKPIDDGSAGHSYVDLTYRNTSHHRVTIHGYAGVSLVAHHNGTQVGRSAIWLTNRRPVTVTLKPGQQTTEIVSIADASSFGSPKHHTVTADGFRVYLPGSRAAAFVPYKVKATTRDVAQLQVDPIGARI